MSEPECTCDLVDVSDLGEPRFVRGFSRGCLIHPESEYERKIREEWEAWEAKIEAAKRAAREAA